MECRTCFEQLTALLDGELTGSESKAVEAHIEGCPHCREELESLRYAFQLVDASLEENLNPPPWNLIENEIDRGRGSWLDLRWLFDLTWRPVAAAFVLAVILVPLFWGQLAEEAELERMFAAYLQERNEEEMIHESIFSTEPVGWVYYNPYAVAEQPSGTNPYAIE